MDDRFTRLQKKWKESEKGQKIMMRRMNMNNIGVFHQCYERPRIGQYQFHAAYSVSGEISQDGESCRQPLRFVYMNSGIIVPNSACIAVGKKRANTHPKQPTMEVGSNASRPALRTSGVYVKDLHPLLCLRQLEGRPN
jgi:hypothetical protein